MPKKPNEIRIPGFTPDYGALIGNDPIYQLSQQQAEAGKIADTTKRNLGFQNAFVNYGQMPDFAALGLNLNPADFGFDQQFADMVGKSNQSGMSLLSQLERARDAARQGMISNLAARGMLRSGATQVGLGQVEQEAAQNRHEAQRELIEYLEGLNAGLAEAERGRAEGLANAAQEAYERQLSLPQNQPTPGFRANRMKGLGWYEGPDGTLYQRDKDEVDVDAARRRYRRMLMEMKAQGKTRKQRRGTRAYRRYRYLSNLNEG